MSDDQYSDEEARGRAAVIKHMLSKPFEPRSAKGKGDDRKPQSPPR